MEGVLPNCLSEADRQFLMKVSPIDVSLAHEIRPVFGVAKDKVEQRIVVPEFLDHLRRPISAHLFI